jgi:hypothetical protein
MNAKHFSYDILPFFSELNSTDGIPRTFQLNVNCDKTFEANKSFQTDSVFVHQKMQRKSSDCTKVFIIIQFPSTLFPFCNSFASANCSAHARSPARQERSLGRRRGAALANVHSELPQTN